MEHDTGLKRELSGTHLLMFGIGGLIGAGIFALSGYLIKEAGSDAIFVFLMAGLFSLSSCLIYAEFSSVIPSSGGGYTFIKSSLPRIISFIGGWLFYVAYISASAFYALTLARYLSIEFSINLVITTILIIVIFTVLNLRGAKVSGNFELLFVLLKVSILLIFSISVFILLNALIGKSLSFQFNITKILGLTTVVFIAFEGYDIISTTGAEARNPEKDIPTTIILTLILGTLIYLLVVFAMLVIVQFDPTMLNIKDFEIIIVVEAEKILGTFGYIMMLFGIFLSIMSAYNASYYAGARILFTMSKDELITEKLSRVSMHKVPHAALIVTSISIFIIALISWIGYLCNIIALENIVVMLGQLSSLSFAFSFALVDVSIYFHRKRFPNINRPFKTPLYPITPLIGVGFAIFTLAHLITSSLFTFIIFIALLLSSIIFYNRR